MTRRTFISGALATTALTALADISPPRTVGMTDGVKGVFLPGSALRVKADTSGRAPIALRITEKYQHGNKGYWYDFAYTAFAPGKYRLSDWLEREDGSATGLLPPVEVTVPSALPAGPPTRLPDFVAELPELGGYRTLLTVFGALWVVGLVGILFWRRPKPVATPAEAEKDVPPVEKLRRLVTQASSGSITPDERAQLDRLVLGFWRERLGLGSLSVVDAIAAIRRHDEAGELLRRVEEWLHRPASAADARPESEVARLMEPYLTQEAMPA